MDASNVTEPDTRKRNPIFIEDFIDIDRPFYALEDRFSGDGQWLAPLATEATRDGESLRMRIGPEWAEQLVTHEVHVTLWPPRERDSSLVRSLTWVPSGWQSLFPLLDGDIELAPIDPYWCRLSLAVAYTPPLGGFGARVDRALFHRVAESTVRSFLTQVAARLMSGVEMPS
ncbi:MAG: hypothetical protein ABSE75_08125 [Acidimicrobiales bacterium]|jgi:hypothetical protein